MMSTDVIHVHAKEGEKHGKVGGNAPFKIDDYL
jgi:hypothetical protein